MKYLLFFLLVLLIVVLYKYQNETLTTNNRNVFIYWVGKEYKLISILRNLIYLHSTNGKGYKVHLINDKNLNKYVKDLPECFKRLKPAHQADFVRVSVICDYGGIWLDSDTLVMDSLDSLFDILDTKDGFFIYENNHEIWNGVFGSKKSTELMNQWKHEIITKLDDKKENIAWTDIGTIVLEKFRNENKNYYQNYEFFNGLDNMYPVNWNNCVEEFIKKPYDNYKNIKRDYQPIIVLVNWVYKELETKTNDEIMNGNMPLNYFINKSFQNKNSK